MIHNENSRVKIPALVHLTRLGYKYIKQKDCSGAVGLSNILDKHVFELS